MYSGAMDVQDIVLWGKVRSNMTWIELVRIRGLCKWGILIRPLPLLGIFTLRAFPSGWRQACEHQSPHR